MTDYDRKVNGNTVFSSSFGYAPGDGVTSTDSTRISAITNGSETMSYMYDDRGSITEISSGSNKSQYRYDAFGQLLRENYSWNGTSYTMIYTYDVGGNITSKMKYDFVDGDGSVGTPLETLNYSYDDANWKDKLTGVNGTAITYDQIGNPLYDGRWTYDWTQGRKLQQITDGTTTVSYKYNNAGIRTEKIVNGVTTEYNIVGDLITREKTGSNAPIYYLYDANGNLWGLNYDGGVYFYVQNAQNDIVGIVDSTGAVVVTYSYDAWGKLLNVSGILAATLGQDNPFRYRGYYFDTESGLYYLQSRYYNPDWSRFINVDVFVSTGQGLLGSNMFAYCLNNPIILSDTTGNIAAFNTLMTDSGSKAAPISARTSKKPSKKPSKKSSKVYSSEQDAAAAFLAKNVSLTSTDGFERCAFIAKVGPKYTLSETYKGEPGPDDGRPWIGLKNVISGVILGNFAPIPVSIVHTQPAYGRDFSTEDWLFSFGSSSILYMGYVDDPKRGVYRMTMWGADRNPDGSLKYDKNY